MRSTLPSRVRSSPPRRMPATARASRAAPASPVHALHAQLGNRATGDIIRRTLGGGRPLDAGVRGDMEARFAHGFDDVRVHTGAGAAAAAASIDARAFTYGRDVVFGAGAYAPQTPAGRRTLAHELTHVVQQRAAPEPLIQRELVYGSGYPRPFATDRAEVGCVLAAPKCVWHPASLDFQASAATSGGGSGAPTFSALLDHIEAAAPGSITELGLLGHANVDYFGLAGRIDAHDVWFSDDGLIGRESLEAEKDRIAKLRNRFASGATITLYGCNAGAGQALLDAISRAFHVCVRGFTNEIFSCLRWHTPSLQIFSRGRTWVATAPLDRPEDVGCENFHADVHDLVPDRQSCAGVPAAQPPAATKPPPAVDAPKVVPTAAPTQPGARRFGFDVQAGGAWSTEGWRAAIDLGLRYSLRSDRVVVIDPTIGAQLLYLPSSGDRSAHIAAAVAELGVRVQQPLRGVYADVKAGGYAGVHIPATSGQDAKALGGFTGAVGVGYHWERLSIGAQARGLVGAGPNQVLVLGAGTLYW